MRSALFLVCFAATSCGGLPDSSAPADGSLEVGAFPRADAATDAPAADAPARVTGAAGEDPVPSRADAGPRCDYRDASSGPPSPESVEASVESCADARADTQARAEAEGGRGDADEHEDQEVNSASVEVGSDSDCGDASSESSAPSDCVEARVVPDADARTLEAQMQALVDESPDCHGTSEGPCEIRSASVDRARPWCQSRGQRLLIIDNIDFTCAPFERVLGYYRIDGEDRFVEESPSVSMQAGVFTILHDMIGRSTYFRSLLQLPAALDRKFTVPSCPIHGSSIAASIARVSPLAQFVLADLGPGTEETLTCDTSTIENQLRRKLASVRSIVDKYGVGYVNLSGSLTLSKVREDYQHCSPSEDWLQQVFGIYVREWYRPLGSLPGVVLVQAAPNAGEATRALQVDDPEFLVDCTAMPNRLRAACGLHDDLETGWDDVPPDGLSWNQYSDALAPELRDLRACVDVYYDFRSSCASSFIAPRALAHLLYLQGVRAAAGQVPLDPPALVAAATHGDPPRLIDPGGNGQFEVARMFPDLP